VVLDYLLYFLGGYVLVDVVAGFNQDCGAGGACAHATCPRYFAFFFGAKPFDGVFKGFKNLK
jgi:hypothetical protein